MLDGDPYHPVHYHLHLHQGKGDQCLILQGQWCFVRVILIYRLKHMGHQTCKHCSASSSLEPFTKREGEELLLYPWRYSKIHEHGLGQLSLGGLLEQVVGQDDFQRSFATSTTLWFCDSVSGHQRLFWDATAVRHSLFFDLVSLTKELVRWIYVHMEQSIVA